MSRSKVDVDNFIASFRRKAKSEQEIQLRGYQFATFYCEAREYALGIKWAQSYLAIKQSDSRAHKLLGNLFEAVKDYGKAIDCYKKSLEFNETQKDLVLRIASLGCTIQNYDVEKLRYWVERAERFYPTHINVHKIKENIFRRSGKLPDYEIYLRNKLAQRKGDYYLNCKLVKLLIEMRRLREAADHILLTQDLESVADQPIWWESTVHTLEIYIKSIRQGEERTAGEETIMEMHSHLLMALCKWIMLSLAMMDKPPHNAVVLLKGLDQCLLRANSLKVNSNWDFALNEMTSQLYYLMGLHLCRMAAMGSFRWSDIMGLVTSCFVQSAQKKLPDMSGRSEYDTKKWTLLASARLSEVSHMLHAFQKQYGLDWLEKCHRSTSTLQSQTQVFHVAFGQEADPNKSFFMSDTNFVKVQEIILDDLVEVVLNYDQDAVLAQPHNLQLLVWLGLQWDVRKDGISPDLGTFIEASFDKLHFASNNLKITSVDNLRLLDIEAFLYVLVKAAKAKRDSLRADGRTDPNQPLVLPVPLCQMLFTEEQEKWFKSVCALYSGNAKSDDRAKMRLAIQKGLEAIRNADQFNIDTPLLIHLSRTFRARMLEEKRENDVPGNEQFLACQRLSVHYWQAAREHLKLLASDKALSPPKHAFFVASQDKIKKEEITALQEEAAVALAEYEFQQGHHQQALNLLSKVTGVTGLFTKALMCKQLSQMEVEGKEDSQITASMILAQGSHLDQCTYSLYSAMDAIQDDHNNSMHEEIQGLLDDVDVEKQQLARKGLDNGESIDVSRRLSNSTSARSSVARTSVSSSRISTDGRNTLQSVGDLSCFQQGLSPDPSPRRLMSELRSMNVSQTRLIDENSQLRTLALSHSRLLEQNSEILSKHNDVMEQNRFLMEQIINLNKELQEMKLNVPPPPHLATPQVPTASSRASDSSIINTEKTIVINANDCRIEHAEAPNLTNPQPLMYYPTPPSMFPTQFLPGYNLTGFNLPGMPGAEQPYMPTMMTSTPGQHYHGEDGYEAEGDAYAIDPHAATPSQKLRDGQVFSTPTQVIAQPRTPEISTPLDGARSDEGFAGFSGLKNIHLKTFFQPGTPTGAPPVVPRENVAAGMKSSSYQPKMNLQPASSPVAPSQSKGEPAPEKSASDAPLLRKILMGSDDTSDPSPAPQTFPVFSSLSSNSRFNVGGGDKFPERAAVSPNFTSGTRLESAKAKEADQKPVQSFSFGDRSEASSNPAPASLSGFSGFTFGGGSNFTPVSGPPVPTSSNQFSKPSSTLFSQPQSTFGTQSTASPVSGQCSQPAAAGGFTGLTFTPQTESTTPSPFAGFSFTPQKTPTAAPQPRKPGQSPLFAGQEAVVDSSTPQTKDTADTDDDDVIVVYERRPTPAQIAMALKLKLPPTFYLYEFKEPCKGCIGCQDIDLAMLFKKENKLSIADTQTGAKEESTQPSQENTSTAPLMFGGSSVSSMTFASISTDNNSTPDFMKQQPSQSFSWLSAGKQLFSSPAGGADEEYDPQYEAIVTLPEVTVLKTGEEDETCLWKERAKLYRYNKDVNQWKERGVGDVKFMQHNNTGRIRILMRREQVLKVCANHVITPDIELKVMQSSDRAWVWSALDFSEGEASMEQLAIKFKKPETANAFRDKFEECKQFVIEAEKMGSKKKAEEKKEEAETQSFVDKLKPKPGTWTCDTCLVPNPPDTIECLACATLKPGAAPTTQATSSKPSEQPPAVAFGGFNFGGTISSPQTSGFSFGGASASSTPSIEEEKEEAETKSFADKFKPKPGTWTCDTCLVPNPPDTVECLACATLKPGAAPTTQATSSKPSEQPPSGAFGGFKFGGTISSPQISGFSFGEASASSTPTTMPSQSTGFMFGHADGGTQKPSTSGFSFGGSKPTGGFSFGSDSTKVESSTEQKSSSSTAAAAAATATVDNTDTTMSLLEMFKPKAGAWSCPACLCQNSAEHKKCPACQTCQPGAQPETSSSSAPSSSSFNFGSTSAFGQLQGNSDSSEQGNATSAAPAKTFSFGRPGKVLPQFSFGGGDDSGAAPKSPASTGYTFGAQAQPPKSGEFMFGSNLNQNAGEEQALDLSSPKKTNDQGCKFSDMAKSFTFQFKMDPEEAAKAEPKSPTKSPGMQRSPGLVKSLSLDKSGDDSYYKDDDCDGLHFEPVVHLDLVELTTGEENEEVMFCHRAKMYRFNKESNEWKERGMGDIKILKHKETRRYRLLMRREQVLKLCANHFIVPEIVLRPNAGSDRSWAWTAMDASDDGAVKSELMAVRFKTSDIAVEFKKAFENAKVAVKKIKSSDQPEPAEKVKDDEPKEVKKDDAEQVKKDDVEEGNGEEEGDNQEEGEKVAKEDKPQDDAAATSAPKLTSNFKESLAAAVRKTMSEDEKKTPNTTFSPERHSVKFTDQGYYPEEERDDLQFKPVIKLAEVEVKTGEEDEEQLFCQRAKMYRWDRDSSQWKERGVGEIKILKHMVRNRCRVLMRRDQVLKICANHVITPEMELKPNAGSDRSLVWTAMDASDMEPQLEQLAVRFKTVDITDEFKSVFEKCQTSQGS